MKKTLVQKILRTLEKQSEKSKSLAEGVSPRASQHRVCSARTPSRRKTLFQAVLLGLSFFVLSDLLAQDLKINAYVNQTHIAKDRQFQLTVELSGEDANRAPQPPLPNLEDFASFLGTSSSMNTQIINGQMTVTRGFTHHFIATKVGQFVIPPIKLQFKGKIFESDSIAIQVTTGPSSGQSRSSNRGQPSATETLAEALFLRASVDKKQVYQNEAVTVTYKLYLTVTITSYGISQLPNTVGFWAEDFPTPQRPTLKTEIINGRRYNVAEIKKIALFPQGPGEKTLDPLEINCEVRVKNRRQRRDLFDSFFDDPFLSLGRTVTRTIRSNAIKIDVLPLPEANKPADFSGAVGKFSLSATTDKQNVKTNEAITLKVTLAGQGNIKILTQPKGDFPSDFEVYDPKISENIKRTGGSISGSKTFEFVLIPRFAGKQTIKPFLFSYFDISRNRYRTLKTPPIEIKVAKGDQPFVSVPLASSKEEVKFIGQDIRFIQLRLPEFQKIGSVFYKQLPFFLIVFFPLVALAGAYGFRKHRDKMSTNVAYARSRKANQMASKRLRLAHRAMTSGNDRGFYGEVSKALMGFVGDKLNVSAAGLMTDEVDSMLRERGVKEETVANYLTCLRTCDLKRFSPSTVDNNEMQNFIEKAKKALISLDKEI
ncbi:MAG: BatD family protein [bacterium]